jgi:NADPH2:quinone reductase
VRAVWLRRFGPPAVLAVEETPEPGVDRGRVLVDVAYANVTFVETQVRAGSGPFPVDLPVIPGNGVGGTVAAVGAGVDPALVGRRVVTATGGSGGYAERVAVPADWLVPVPEGVPLDDAVALMADGRTALLLLGTAAVRPGDRVLVEAAAGGVGTLLVQLARSAGARVVAVAGGARKVEVARGLGAEVAVDYRRPEWPDEVRSATGAVDVVFDGVGGDVARKAFELLDPGGRMVSFGMASGAWAQVDDGEAARRGVTVVRPAGASPERLRELTAEALGLAAAGRLRPVIGQRFPLERAADAHAAIETRATVGKTLLEVRPTAGPA